MHVLLHAETGPIQIPVDLPRIYGKQVRSVEGDKELDNLSKSERSICREFFHAKLVGRSPKFRVVLDIIESVADTDAPVLIHGETGTGKELTARAIHYSSRRRERPFIPVNCGAIPDNLLESELFGHAAGAFTDAKHSRLGLVVEADGGTLFLDEIQALSPKGQVVMLRFLDDCSFRPVGQTRSRKVNTRIVSASNLNLLRAAHEDLFRFDLLYRLAVVSFTLPPLRERGEDKHLLADHLLKECPSFYNRPFRPLDEHIRDLIESYDWPGNVRELRNFLHSAFLMSSGPKITIPPTGIVGPIAASCPRDVVPPMDAPFKQAKAQMMNAFERNYIRRMLRKTNGNISQAARLSGKDRRSFGRLMKKHNIDASAMR